MNQDDIPNSGELDNNKNKNKDDNTLFNSGVGAEEEEKFADKVDTPQDLYSDFGSAPYWNNKTIATDTECYMISVIATYSNRDGIRSTPQYSFSRGFERI